MTTEEMKELVNAYWIGDGYTPPRMTEHRVDLQWSEPVIYSLLRDFKPTSLLEFGTSYGGTACLTMTALLKNGKPFKFVASEMNPQVLGECTANIMKACGKLPTMVGKIEDNLDKVPKELDWVLIDTNHDLENCKWYMENIIPRVKKGGMVVIHDWAVREIDGKLVYENNDGSGHEIVYLMDLYEKGTLPLEKFYWTWGDGERTRRGGPIEAATSIWLKK
jgi:cephalosporin hydroxylase